MQHARTTGKHLTQLYLRSTNVSALCTALSATILFLQLCSLTAAASLAQTTVCVQGERTSTQIACSSYSTTTTEVCQTGTGPAEKTNDPQLSSTPIHNTTVADAAPLHLLVFSELLLCSRSKLCTLLSATPVFLIVKSGCPGRRT